MDTSQSVESPATTQVDSALSQPVSAQPMTSFLMQTVTQPDTFTTPPLESSARGTNAELEKQLSQHSYAILSNLRHLAANQAQIGEIFEEQTRVFFIRENAPSPESSPNHSSPELPQAVEAIVDADSGSDSQSLLDKPCECSPPQPPTSN